MLSIRELGGAALWAVATALIALGFVGAASIGLFILPFGFVAAGILAARETPGVWGAAVGAGLLFAAIGFADLLDGIPQCTGEGVSDPPQRGTPSRCEEGGIPSAVFLTLGGLGVVGGFVGAASSSHAAGEPS